MLYIQIWVYIHQLELICPLLYLFFQHIHFSLRLFQKSESITQQSLIKAILIIFNYIYLTNMQEFQYLPYKLGSLCSHGLAKSSTNYVDVACSRKTETYHRISQAGKICNKCAMLIMNSVNSVADCPCCTQKLQLLVNESGICTHRKRNFDQITIKCLKNEKDTHEVPFKQKVCQNCYDKIRAAFMFARSCVVCDEKQNELLENIEKTITKPSYYFFDNIIKQMKANNDGEKEIKQEIQNYCLAQPKSHIKSKFENEAKELGENLPEYHQSKRYQLYPKCPKHRNDFINLCNNCLVSILNVNCCPYGCSYEKKEGRSAKVVPPFVTETGFICLYPKQAKDYIYLDYFHIRYIEQPNRLEKWEGSLKKIKYEGKQNICSKFSLYSSSVQVSRLAYFYSGGASGQNIINLKTTNTAFLIKISEGQNTFNIEDLPNMTEPRASHSTVFYKDYVYVVGGLSKQNAKCLETCEKYNLTSKKWERIASLKLPRSKPNVFQFKGHIYAVGGISNHENIFNTPCQRYNIEKDNWEIIQYQGYDVPFLTASTSFTKCWGINDTENIFIFGGSNYENPTYFVQELVFKDNKFRMNPSGVEQRLNYNRCEAAVSLMKTDTPNESIAIIFGGLEEHESILSLDAVRLKVTNNQIVPFFVYDNVNIGSYRLLLRQNSQSAYQYMTNKLIQLGVLNKQKLSGEDLLKNEANLHIIQKMWYGIGKCIVGFSGL